MKILYPKLGKHPTKGYIDFRWKYTGDKHFRIAYGPIGAKSFIRFVKWFWIHKFEIIKA